jgi:hypothetical protein
MAKRKRINNNLQNNTQKTKKRDKPHKTPEVNAGAPEGLAPLRMVSWSSTCVTS